MRQRILAFMLAVGLAALLVVSPARAAEGSLILAALRTLEREYVRPVKPIPLLNAAIASLRRATGLGEDALPDIPLGLSESAAVGKFNDAFRQAVQAGKQPISALAYTATRGMLASLQDSHVYFMDPAQYKEHGNNLARKPRYVGIGLIVRHMKAEDGSNFFFIEDVLPESPASKAGLQEFDRILQIDGNDLKGMTSKDESELIRGPVGSTVMLTIQRKDQRLTVSVVRAAIQFQSAVAEFVRPGVAHVELFDFSEGAGNQLRSALRSLASQGPIKSVILDLRGNRGGWMVEGGVIAGAFLPPHTLLARVIGRTHPPIEAITTGPPLVPQAPLAVLIDGDTSSAAEAVALGLRSARRATLVGQRSAGALGGSRSFPLPEGGMSITVDWVVGPNYEQVERVGITPEIQVELTAADVEKGEDTQLEAALKTVDLSGRAKTEFYRTSPRVRCLVAPSPFLFTFRLPACSASFLTTSVEDGVRRLWEKAQD